MRRLSLLLLVLLLAPMLLVGCGPSAPEDGELKNTATALIEGAVTVNTVFLGDGIPTNGEAFENYLFADEAWIEETGIDSVEGLIAAAEAVYTEEVVSMLTRYACFDQAESLAHYRDRPAPGKGLLVLALREGIEEGSTCTYRTGEIAIKEKSGTRALITLPLTVSPSGEGEPQERMLELPLVRGEDGWRLDKLTFVAYDDGN